MKKNLLFISILICITLGACGSDPAVEEVQEYYDIVTETRQIFSEKEEDNYLHAGTQYYHGEPIQIWAERSQGYDELGEFWCERDFYIVKEDGSRELLIENVSVFDIPHGSWWIDEQNRIFVLEVDGIKALDREGNVLFHTVTEESVLDICMLNDGTYILLLYENGVPKLAALNPETGAIDVYEKIAVLGGTSYIAPLNDGLMMAGGDGVFNLDLEDGKKDYVLSWSGTSYVWSWTDKIGDFCVREGGSVEFLFEKGIAENLKYEELGAGKVPIVIRSMSVSEWLREQVVVFNKGESDYYIILDERDIDTDLEVFQERTDMLLAAGQGADIIMWTAVNDFDGLLEKGAFEDMSPYLEESGIQEEAYFANTFLYTTEKKKELYGVNLNIHMRSMWLDGELAQDMGEVTIENLIKQLKNRQGKEVFIEGDSSGQILNFFLECSDDLWGMVDWERGKCDFSDGLFWDMVEVAARYGDAENNGYPALAGMLLYLDVYTFAHEYADLKTEGNQAIGWFFDDGGYPLMVYTDMVTVNSNSKHKEGAWEVIEFLLSEESQTNYGEHGLLGGFPVYRGALKEMEEILYEKKANDFMGVFYFSEEQMEALYTELDSTHLEPTRTLPILDIIYEETQEYFSGVKPLDEVIDVIENRVQLYLDEIN